VRAATRAYTAPTCDVLVLGQVLRVLPQCLLKEGRRVVFQLPDEAARDALDRWISWARRCRMPAFVKLQKSIVKRRDRILAAIEHNLSNGLIESTNTKIRVLTRVAFGFHPAGPLIVRAMLTLAGHRPALPHRN
jgi:transposase